VLEDAFAWVAGYAEVEDGLGVSLHGRAEAHSQDWLCHGGTMAAGLKPGAYIGKEPQGCADFDASRLSVNLRYMRREKNRALALFPSAPLSSLLRSSLRTSRANRMT